MALGWLKHGLQGATAGGLAGATLGGPFGAALGVGGGALLGGLMGLDEGRYRTFGPSEREIEAQLGAARQAGDESRRRMFEGGLRRLQSSAQARGFGNSGSVAMGVPSLHESMGQQALVQEAQLQALANQMRASRQQVYQSGLGETVMPMLADAAGTYAFMQGLGGLGQAPEESLARFGSGRSPLARNNGPLGILSRKVY